MGHVTAPVWMALPPEVHSTQLSGGSGPAARQGPTAAHSAAAHSHVSRGVSTATSFFGINTIPIALDEADQLRMWVQVGTAMSSYQAISIAALASAPRAEAPPALMRGDDGGDDERDDSGNDGTIIDDDSGDPYQLSWREPDLSEIIHTRGAGRRVVLKMIIIFSTLQRSSGAPPCRGCAEYRKVGQ